MARRMTLLAAGLLWAAWCAGCVPDELPAYVNDGKTIVAMADDGTGEKVLWTYDVRTGTVSIHRPPEKWEFHGARMLGGQIWLDSCLPSKARPGEWDAETCERFDPVKKEFLPVPPELQGRILSEGIIPACLDGEKCLLVPQEGDGKDHDYDVLSYPELKKRKAVHDDGLMAAGNFWSLRVTRGNPEDPREIRRIDVFSPEGKKVSSIARDDTGQAGEVTDFLHYARVGDDGKALLLIFAERGIYGFSVFDASDGEFLWGHESVNDWSLGTPLIRRTEVWTMQLTEERDAIALVRYSPGAGAEAQKANCEEFVAYSIEDMDVDNGDSRAIGQFTPSPDGSHFIMVINGNPSRLLFIPIRRDVTAQDVRAVELTVTKPPARLLEK